MHPIWPVVAYVATVGVVALTAALRREPTALRGRSLFWLTVLFAALWIGSMFATARRPSVSALTVVLLVLAVTYALRSRWLVVHATPDLVDESITGSAKRLLLVCEGAPGNRRIVCSAVVLDVRSTPFGLIGTHVSLPPLPREKKLELFRKLLGKQYKTAVPLPSIRL